MTSLKWPPRWQPDAVAAALPYLDSEDRLDVLVGPPETSLSGTRISGYLYTGETGEPMMIHDHSGRQDVYPWRLLDGPVLKITLLRARRPGKILYQHPQWQRRST